MQLSIKKINELTRVLRSIRGIHAAFLFGSQGRMQAGKRSDVDLAVQFDSRLSRGVRPQVALRTFQTVTRVLGRNDVDLVELNQAPVLLRYAATVHGRPLFIRPRRDTHRLAFRAMQDFEDFRPYLERQRHALKKKLARV